MSSWQNVSLRFCRSLRSHCHPTGMHALFASLPSALTTVPTAEMTGIAGLREVIAGLRANWSQRTPTRELLLLVTETIIIASVHDKN